jgi:hypothetical protein
VLTSGSSRAKPATGEVRLHCGKTSENRTTGAWHGGQADDSAAKDVVATQFHLPEGQEQGYPDVNLERIGRPSGKCRIKERLDAAAPAAIRVR